MGRDKALLVVDGTTMASRVAAALRAAGADDVCCIGMAVPGEAFVADDHPGEGPLGGVLTALRWSPAGVVVVAACDLLAPEPGALARAAAELVAHPAAGVAVPVVAGREQWLHAAWRSSAADRLNGAFDAGERGLGRAVAATLAVHTYDGGAGGSFADADEPGDLPL
jgi:molybdopterin-guanine dinucleotide biosynthesis protein A